MDDEDDGAEVIVLRPGAEVEDEQRPLATSERPEDRPWCMHRLTRLDTEARRAYCRECGREVPLFDVLHALARDWERYIEGRMMALRRRNVVEESLRDLERQEANAKARIRNAKRRADPEERALLRRICSAYRGMQRKYLAAAVRDAQALLDRLDQEAMKESGAQHDLYGDGEEAG